MRLIINADDLGHSAAVNEAVFSLMELGRVTSASLMAAAPGFEQAARQSSRFPHCSFGAHLTLTEFRPLSNPTVFQQEGLLDEQGEFNRLRFRAVRPSARLREAVFQEWSLQIRRLLDCGVPLSHLDSHHQAHTTLWLFGTLKRLQRTFGIAKVRPRMNWHYGVEENRPPLLRVADWFWNRAARCRPRTRSADYLTSFDRFLKSIAAGDYPPHSAAVEIMVHPGQPFCNGETQRLRGDWPAALPVPVTFISYHEL